MRFHEQCRSAFHEVCSARAGGKRLSLPAAHRGCTLVFSTMVAAEDLAVPLDPMPYHPASAVSAVRRKLLDRAFKTVEIMASAGVIY